MINYAVKQVIATGGHSCCHYHFVDTTSVVKPILSPGELIMLKLLCYLVDFTLVDHLIEPEVSTLLDPRTLVSMKPIIMAYFKFRYSRRMDSRLCKLPKLAP